MFFVKKTTSKKKSFISMPSCINYIIGQPCMGVPTRIVSFNDRRFSCVKLCAIFVVLEVVFVQKNTTA